MLRVGGIGPFRPPRASTGSPTGLTLLISAGLPALALLILGWLAPSAHAAYTGYEPGPPRYSGTITESDVPIRMSDGTVLRADVTRPAEGGSPVEDRLPAVLTVTAYNKMVIGGAGGLASPGTDMIVRRGYVYVVVDARGTGSSEGEWDAWGPRERADQSEIARWVTSQEWADGDLVLYGASYMGINQFFTAADKPPGLKAIFPINPSADIYRDIVWPGGNVNVSFIPLWIGLVTGAGVLPPSFLGTEPAAGLGVLLSRVIPGAAWPVEAISEAGLGDEEVNYDGDLYRQRSPETYVDDIDVPTFLVGGWYDLFQRGTPRLYEKLDLPPGQKRLLMGPWYHITTGEGLGRPGAPDPIEHLALAWFERWVRGVDNGIDQEPPVVVNRLGPDDEWTTHASWPPPQTSHPRLYLRSEPSGSSSSAASGHDGTLSSDPPGSVSEVGPEGGMTNGLCSRSAAQWTAGLVAIPSCADDNRIQERGALTFTTDPVEQPLALSGPIGLTIRAKSTRPDTTITATLTDVSPDGRSSQITAGWLRAGMRELDAERTVYSSDGDVIQPWHPFTAESERPLEPGRPETMHVEIFGTGAVIQPGHRLRLTVTSWDIPHMLPSLGPALNSLGAHNTIVLDPEDPSYLTLTEGASSAAAVSALRVSPSSYRARARAGHGAGGRMVRRTRSRLRFSLSERSDVRVTVHREVQGRRAGNRCRAARGPVPRARRCVRRTRVGAFTRRGVRSGERSLLMPWRVGGRLLSPGRYRATVVATGASGERSEPRRRLFRVRR